VSPEEQEPAAERRRERECKRRRLAEIFGDALPESTRDDQDDESDRSGGNARDAEILRDVPPHHT
jgi:hypothetical protein